MIGGPTSYINKILNSLNVEDDCSNFKDLPDIHIILKEYLFILTPKDYVLTS